MKYYIAVLGEDWRERAAFRNSLFKHGDKFTIDEEISEYTRLSGFYIGRLKLDEDEIELKFIMPENLKTNVSAQIKDMEGLVQLGTDEIVEVKGHSIPVITWKNEDDAYQLLIKLCDDLKKIEDAKPYEEALKDKAAEEKARAIGDALLHPKAETGPEEKEKKEKSAIERLTDFFKTEPKAKILSEKEEKQLIEKHSPQTWLKLKKSEDEKIEVEPSHQPSSKPKK
jgi:hypothetical protein